MDIDVGDEINVSNDSSQLSFNENPFKVKTEKIDIDEQFLDETGIHNRIEWMSINGNANPSQHIVTPRLDSTARLQESQNNNSMYRERCTLPKGMLYRDKPKNPYQIINWQLLVESVKKRSVLWNYFLNICLQCMTDSTQWREACLILQKKFGEIAEVDQEILTFSESDENDLTMFAEDQWGTYFYLRNSTIKEDNDVGKSKSRRSSAEDSDESVEEPGENSKTKCAMVKSSNRSAFFEKKRIKRIHKRNFCYYCKLPVLNFPRHIERLHPNEPEVQDIVLAPKSSNIRKEMLTRLRKKGNYLKSVETSQPVKLRESKNAVKYKPCPFCLGFYSSKMLIHHRRICKENPRMKSIITDRSLLDETRNIQKRVRKNVFFNKISKVEQPDDLISEVRLRLTRHLEGDLASKKVLQLYRLLVRVKKLNSEVNTVLDLFRPKFYDTVVTATKQLARWDEQKKCYKLAKFARDICETLKQCCEIIIDLVRDGLCIYPMMDATETESDIQIFLNLLEDWETVTFQHTIENKIDLIPNKIDVDSVDYRNSADKDEESHTPLSTNINPSFENHPKSDEIQEAVDIGDVRKPKSKRKGSRKVPWTEKQKEVVKTYFKTHIKMKKPPKRHECNLLKSKNEELLSNKDWLKIKVFIQNVYTEKYKS